MCQLILFDAFKVAVLPDFHNNNLILLGNPLIVTTATLIAYMQAGWLSWIRVHFGFSRAMASTKWYDKVSECAISGHVQIGAFHSLEG